VLRDSITHLPDTGLSITTINIYYTIELAAQVDPTALTALSAATDSHADNKGFHVGLGLYRIDWPDAAFVGAAGTRVILTVVCAGADTTFLEVELSPSVALSAAYDAAKTAAQAGDEMTLSAAYDAAKTAAQAGDEMTLSAAYDAAKTAAQAGDEMTLSAAYDAAKTAAQAGDEMTLGAAYDAAKTAAQAGDEMTLPAAYDAAKTAAQAGNAMTLTAAYDLAKTAAQAGDQMTLGAAYDAAKTAANAADVNAQVLDVLSVDTFAEPTSVPPATSSILLKLSWLFMLAKNKRTQTASASAVRNNADGATIATALVSDDGTTFTQGKWS
jgi:hypothetical protein